jgi:hypothetical protein
MQGLVPLFFEVEATCFDEQFLKKSEIVGGEG